MEIFETRDRALLREALRDDPARSFYMSADLEWPHFDRCRWLVAREAGAGHLRAVVLVFQGLEVPTVLVAGDLNALVAIVSQAGPELPSRCYMKLTALQRDGFGKVFSFSQVEQLDVMIHDKPAPTTTTTVVSDGFCVGLMSSSQPLPPILSVYRDYPGNFFDPAQLRTGVYAAAWIGGELVAVGGTHAYAPGEGVAALGNVTTAARFRGRGLCRAVTGFLVAELRRRGCETIGLHVASANAPAIACYRRSGFERHASIFQLLAQRRESG